MGDNLSTTKRVQWRGVTLDERTAAMCAELARITGPIQVTPVQGSFRPSSSYSASTHSGAGAVDISIRWLPYAQRIRLVELARKVGFAAWRRTSIPGVWEEHLHAIAVPPSGRRKNDGHLNYQAFAQVIDYYNGRSGLASGGKDNGPRNWVGVTWESYSAAKAAAAIKAEREWDEMASKNEVKAALREVLNESSVSVGNTKWSPLHVLDWLRRAVVDINHKLDEVQRKIGA